MSFEDAGKSGSVLRKIIEDELDSAVSSLGLTTLQRSLLWQELGLGRYDSSGPLPVVTDANYEHRVREAERVYFLAYVRWFRSVNDEAASLPMPIVINTMFAEVVPPSRPETHSRDENGRSGRS